MDQKRKEEGEKLTRLPPHVFFSNPWILMGKERERQTPGSPGSAKDTKNEVKFYYFFAIGLNFNHIQCFFPFVFVGLWFDLWQPRVYQPGAVPWQGDGMAPRHPVISSVSWPSAICRSSQARECLKRRLLNLVALRSTDFGSSFECLFCAKMDFEKINRWDPAPRGSKRLLPRRINYYKAIHARLSLTSVVKENSSDAPDCYEYAWSLVCL